MDAYVTEPASVRYQQLMPSRLGRVSVGGEHTNVPGRLVATMPLRYWDTYALVLVLSGTADFSDVAGLAAELGPGDLLLMFPGHGYRYQAAPACRWSEIYVHFDGPVFDLWRQEGILDPAHPIWHLAPVGAWAERLRHLLRPPDRPPPVLTLRRVCELQAFLCDALVAGSGDDGAAASGPWLSRARDVLDRQLDAPVPDWDAVARALGLSAERFRKKFTQVAGQTPFAYVTARRVEHSCQLLQQEELLIKEVAAACGFRDEFHFSRRFKQVTGLSPSAYRAKVLARGEA